MAVYITDAQAGALVKQVGFPVQDQATMVAIGHAESGLRVDAVSPPNSNGTVDRGWLQINSVHGYDNARLTSDALYTAQAGKDIYDSQGLRAWSTYNNGAYQKFMGQGRQGVAQSANIVGVPAVGQPNLDQSVRYGPLGPQITTAGKGVPLTADAPTSSLTVGTLRILGQQIGADVGISVINEPTWTAGMDTVPHLDFSVIDPQKVANKGLFDLGNQVTWLDLTLQIDTAVFAPGDHGSGEADVTAQDDIVYALRQLRGPATAGGISASTWLYRELSTARINPDQYLLAEAVPTQSFISRDVPDPTGAVQGNEPPSAWTTIVRLANELGKWVFVSGRRIVFGSAQFAMQWTAAAPAYIGWDLAPDAERFITAPTTTREGIVERVNVLKVVGRVPHTRAPLFRPGCAAYVYGILGSAATRDNPIHMMVMEVNHVIANATDGAEITLIEPVDPPPHPPGQQNANLLDPNAPTGAPTGAADGQVETFVRIALSQTGKAYQYGAVDNADDLNPRSFDCSSLVQWSATRAGIPGVPRTSEDQINICIPISTVDAINTRGALLHHPGHIAISLGNGHTIEASQDGVPVGQLNATTGRFNSGGLLPNAKGYPGRP